MSRYLLDVGTVLALLDRRHEFHERAHERAHAWARREPDARWLTSPIVQNGVIRIASQPAYPSRRGSAAVVRDTLQAFCRGSRHEFCPDDVSLTDDARFATLDQRIPADAARGARVVLPA